MRAASAPKRSTISFGHHDVALRARHLVAVGPRGSCPGWKGHDVPGRRASSMSAQRLDEEARTGRRRMGVLDAADVLVDRHQRPSTARNPTPLIIAGVGSSAEAISSSQRTCPSCRSRAGGGPPNFGHLCSSTPRRPGAAKRPAGSGSRRPRPARPATRSTGSGDMIRSARSRRSDLSSPSNAWRDEQPVANS